MREIECKSGGDTESERQIKRAIDCKRGGGIESRGRKWKVEMQEMDSEGEGFRREGDGVVVASQTFAGWLLS